MEPISISCRSNFLEFSVDSPAAMSSPPIPPARKKHQVRRTVTFNVGHSDDAVKFQAARTKISEGITRQTRSFGAADSYGVQHRKQFLKKPKEKLTTAYTSWMLEHEDLQERSPTSSPAFKRVGARRHRLNRHRSFPENDAKETVRPSVKVSSRNKLGRHHSALTPSSKTKHVDATKDFTLSPSNSLSYLANASADGRKVKLTSSRMKGMSRRRQNLRKLLEVSQEDISNFYHELSSNEETSVVNEVVTLQLPVITNSKEDSISWYEKDLLSTTSDEEECCHQYDLMTVNYQLPINLLPMPSTQDIAIVKDASSPREDVSVDSLIPPQEESVWRQKKGKVTRVPTFIQRQEAWQSRRARYLNNKNLSNLDESQAHRPLDSSSSSSSETESQALGANNTKTPKMNHGKISSSVGNSTDDCSTGYGSLTASNTNYLHNWRPSPPSDLLYCCGCERCCAVLNTTFNLDGDNKDCCHPFPHSLPPFPSKSQAAAVEFFNTSKANSDTVIPQSLKAAQFLHVQNSTSSAWGKSSPTKSTNQAENLPSYKDERKSNRNPILGTSVCLSPTEALVLFGPQLTVSERMEIEFYPEIYFLGPEVQRIDFKSGRNRNKRAARDEYETYDDEYGNYRKVLHDHLAYRYEILEIIGWGVSGQVVRSLDHKTGKQVAIKIIRNTKSCHRQGLLEIRILDQLRRKDPQDRGNAVRMLDYFYFRSHLCISMELLNVSLYQMMEVNQFRGFDEKQIRKLSSSITQCLQFLKRERIIHGDLKPENLLLKNSNSFGSAKVIDFGSACYIHQQLQSYVQSRFYRSPEVILGLPYGCPIDMWSFGCILAELHTGHPIFSGENEAHQLALFMEVLGPLPRRMVAGAPRRRLFFDSKGNVRHNTDIKGPVHPPGSRNLASILKGCDPIFLDFVSRCFEWDPTIRMTPDEARRHEWLAGPAATYPERPGRRIHLDQHQVSILNRVKGTLSETSSCCNL